MAFEPLVSVVMPTMRVGGLDIVCAGLQAQTCKDFELVICDGLYEYRRELVRERALGFDFPITHVPPLFENPFPVASFCRYANTALAHARGKIALMITDYTWLPPGAVAAHAQERDPREGLMCPHQYAAMPLLRPDFPTYQNEDTDRYAADIAAGKLDDCMWSILADEFSGDPSLLLLDSMANSDPKLVRGAGPCESWLFHGKSESCRLSSLLEANGWDEDLDGTHGWQDTELANRLAYRGMNWQCQPLVTYIVNPRHVFPFAKRMRPYQTNETVWRGKEKAGYPTPNSWSLAEKHSELLRKNDI